jgi:hypothetical protein
MAKYRKKPVVIEAVQWDGTNYDEIGDWMGLNATCEINGAFVIPTLEGDMLALPNDWIIKGTAGEFYPCKPHVFEQVFEQVFETEREDRG